MIENFQKELQINARAGAPVIQIISHDILRIHAECVDLAKELNAELYIWNRSKRLQHWVDSRLKAVDEDRDSIESALNWFTGEVDESSAEGQCILLMEDAHPDLTEHQPHVISCLRNYVVSKGQGQFQDKHLILSQPVMQLPVELEKDIQVLNLPYPNREELKTLMQATKQRFELADGEYEESARLIDAALGLSTSEAQLAFAKAAVAKKRLTESEVPLIVAEKEQIIKKTGLLEYFHPQVSLDDLGGLGNLKKWLKRRGLAFTEAAREFGLEFPRGILMLGLPGTGKSLAAKSVSSLWQLPLLRLDMGKVFGGIVGQSEENIRRALQIAETISPCVLWVDEIEKGLSGMQSSGSTDGGTTARVLGTFLTWMQEKTKPVFVLATANNISQLPPELLRKGRVDEIFFVDLPTKGERTEILKIHLKKRGERDELIDEKELEELASQTSGFTGAELEEVVKDSLFRAFSDGREIEKLDLGKAIKSTSPLSVTMKEIIDSTRKWAKGRAVPASDISPEDLPETNESKAPRLPQEFNNPFIKGNHE